MRVKNCLTTVAIRPYLGEISMGAIGANVTLAVLRVRGGGKGGLGG